MLGLIVLISLTVPNSGALGATLRDGLRLLFGNGAFLLPIVLWLAAGALVFGYGKLSLPEVVGGGLLVFLAVLGWMAKPGSSGDWFQADMLRASGGYLGAVVGFLLSMALGQGRTVVLGMLVLLGLLMMFNLPLAQVLRGLVRALQAGWRGTAVASKAIASAATETASRAAEAVKRQAERRRAQADTRPAPASSPKPAESRETTSAPQTATQRQEPKVSAPATSEKPKVPLPAPAVSGNYTLPPLSLLKEPPAPPRRSQAEIREKIAKLEETLQDFGIEANVVEVAHGPTVTRYEIQLAPGIKVNRVVNLADNLAMALAAIAVRVEAPIPGKNAIGVEVPNDHPQIVTLREVMENPEFWNAPSLLTFALGKDVAGTPKYADLARMPHLLIGGATNSGKSMCLLSLITSLLFRATPRQLRFVMIDPKRVELTLFDGIPHLMCPVVRDVKLAAGALRAVLKEMDRRYDLFANAGVRNIQGYNERVPEDERLPYVVVIIDELADLMMQAASEVETSIARLAQLARATGIHLVIATQRPSVDVITGTIKANIASRIAFAVSSQVDSRTILDMAGAERLLGRGDMLYLPIDASKPIRIQGCYVSEAEIEAVADFWRAQESPVYLLSPTDFDAPTRSGGDEDEEDDELYPAAVRLVVAHGQASTSMLQRRFKIGYGRAARLLDLMERRGIVGPLDGAKPRQVLITRAEAEQILKQYESRRAE
ncbi:MAG: DNA translocase FtsK 4TM domain-containing protein [Fimbriimonadales bacterium]|nr:DNA translocase FtsK 4TM domain-containing protein [Fimbriimonadales bacterium]MDW8051047.1 DNA translocase FtsK 4TM domain-containing protein [Armatimonadota bacterium]